MPTFCVWETLEKVKEGRGNDIIYYIIRVNKNYGRHAQNFNYHDTRGNNWCTWIIMSVAMVMLLDGSHYIAQHQEEKKKD